MRRTRRFATVLALLGLYTRGADGRRAPFARRILAQEGAGQSTEVDALLRARSLRLL